MRRVLYTLHGDAGAIRVEDDDIEVVRKREQIDGTFAWETESACVASSWTDASHATWFGSVLEELEVAIRRRDIANTRVEDALRCVEAIDASYRSARNGGHEVSLRAGETSLRTVTRRSFVYGGNA
jgi:hypothetical protein